MEGVRSGLFAGLLPFYGERIGLSAAAFALGFTLHQLAENTAKTLGGLVAERLGYGLTLGLAAFGGLAVLLLLPHLPGAWAFWGLGLFWGLLMSSLLPGLMTLASRIARPGREARALSFSLALLMPWAGIGVIGVGQVAQRDPEAGLWLLRLVQGLALVLALSLLRFRIPLPPTKQERVAWGRLLYFIPGAFGQTFAPALVSLFILRFAKEMLGLEPLALGGVLLLGGGVTFGLLPLTGRWVDRKGYRLPLLLAPLLLGLTLLGLGLGVDLKGVLLLAVLGGVGFALGLPAWNGLLAKNLPQENRAAIWGGIMTLEGLGIALGPAVGGVLWEAFGPKAPFLAGALVYFSLCLFYAWSLRRAGWN